MTSYPKNDQIAKKADRRGKKLAMRLALTKRVAWRAAVRKLTLLFAAPPTLDHS